MDLVAKIITLTVFCTSMYFLITTGLEIKRLKREHQLSDRKDMTTLHRYQVLDLIRSKNDAEAQLYFIVKQVNNDRISDSECRRMIKIYLKEVAG